ncbi:MAG TPA: DegV family protein [Candidatus Dormibacteraeota bacterium]|nr:DegV family protein [Candidatus Dormibacteraeota bacterium]
MTVRIVTDSTCDLPESRRQEAGVVTVPLRLHFGDQEFRDRVDLDDRQFLDRLRSAKVPPQTSQPPPGDFETVYRRLLEDPLDQVVSIHIAAALSGTVGSANLAAQAVDPDRIQVVDSRTVSLGTGFQVLAGVELAERGRSATEIAEALRPMSQSTGIICLLDTLRYLQMGGRIGRVQAMVGSALSIKPLISLGEDGAVVPVGRVRSRTVGIRRLSELLVEHRPLARCGVLYVGDPTDAERLLQDARGTFPGMEILLQHASPVIGSHCGPGTIAYCYLEARS